MTDLSTRTPPRTYQEWLACFDMLRNSGCDEELLKILNQGSLYASQQITDSFYAHLVNLLNDMIDLRTRRFVRNLNKALEMGDAAGFAPLLRRFHKDILQCFFFMNIECIPIDFRHELSQRIEKQTIDFLNDVNHHLSVQDQDTDNSDTEDILYEIRRLKHHWNSM